MDNKLIQVAGSDPCQNCAILMRWNFVRVLVVLLDVSCGKDHYLKPPEVITLTKPYASIRNFPSGYQGTRGLMLGLALDGLLQRAILSVIKKPDFIFMMKLVLKYFSLQDSGVSDMQFNEYFTVS